MLYSKHAVAMATEFLPKNFNLKVFKRGCSMFPRNFVFISCKMKQQELLECNTLTQGKNPREPP